MVHGSITITDETSKFRIPKVTMFPISADLYHSDGTYIKSHINRNRMRKIVVIERTVDLEI